MGGGVFDPPWHLVTNMHTTITYVTTHPQDFQIHVLSPFSSMNFRNESLLHINELFLWIRSVILPDNNDKITILYIYIYIGY